MTLLEVPKAQHPRLSRERRWVVVILGGFLVAWLLPVGSGRFWSAVQEALTLVHWYAREHVILCLIPAFFIAGAISLFVSRATVLRYMGPQAPLAVAYPMAATSGGILAVCSCTVLPLFAGIHKRGAGLGPATAFLYAGPAINVLAIILTARVLGASLGLARAVGAIVFAVVIGLLMQFIFRREEQERVSANTPMNLPDDDGPRALWQDGTLFASMIGVLVFANWAPPGDGATGPWASVYAAKWVITAGFGAVLAVSILRWLRRDEVAMWTEESWGYAKQIMPLLLIGVLVAGFLLGGPDGGDGGIIPAAWVETAVGGNSLTANAFAAVAGAFMYFATLTEVPILAGLLNSGMGEGPALALLLAGPALSLPNMLVIRSVLGTRKTAVYIALVVVMSTIAGMAYGWLVT
jgi:uncharacterized protein